MDIRSCELSIGYEFCIGFMLYVYMLDVLNSILVVNFCIYTISPMFYACTYFLIIVHMYILFCKYIE